MIWVWWRVYILSFLILTEYTSIVNYTALAFIDGKILERNKQSWCVTKKSHDEQPRRVTRFSYRLLSITFEFEQELLALQRDCAAGNAFERLLEKGHRRPPQNSPRTFDIKFQSLDLEGEKNRPLKCHCCLIKGSGEPGVKAAAKWLHFRRFFSRPAPFQHGGWDRVVLHITCQLVRSI